MSGRSLRAFAGLHVMHVVHSLHPGGMEFGVVRVVNGLDAMGIVSSICSTAPADPELKALVVRRVRIFELSRRPGNDPRLVWTLFRLMRKERPDVVHTHGWGTLLEGLVAARLAAVPFIVHGEHGTLQLKPYQRRLQRTAWGRVNRVLSVSSRLAERMSRETGFPPDRIRTLPNGVDLSRFGRIGRGEARSALNLPADALIVGTVGRLVAVKDQASLLDAVATLRRRGLPVTTVIAGDGPLRGELERRAARLDIATHVCFLGHRTDVETVLAAMDVFVLPSVSEGMSNTILEAMAAGLPVVATRVGGADELVVAGETGLLVPPGSSEQLATALAAVLGDADLRRSMAGAARKRAASEFSLESSILAYKHLYEELALGHTRREQQAVNIG